MIRVGHLLDKTAGWEHRLGVTHLADRLPSDRYAHHVAALDPAVTRRLSIPGIRNENVPRFFGIEGLHGPGVLGFVTRRRIDIVHAWGVAAALGARGLVRTPLVLHLFDPRVAARQGKVLRMLARPERFAVVCSSEIVRRRLIERGVPPELSVVIRPGVDFQLINRYRRSDLRATLGPSRDDFVVVLPEPLARAGGQFEGGRAACFRHQVAGDVWILVPGRSDEQRRLGRFAATVPGAGGFVMAGGHHPFEALLCASDALLITPRGDFSTTSIAWAMGAGVAVVGTAVHCVAELIAHKVNGLLFKQVRGRSLSASAVGLLLDRASQRRAAETARGQAYEVFGLRRYAEQMMRLYDNVLRGVAPGEGIVDSAAVM